jgi:DNA repair exonuclease SbcCD nuclease subunit
MRFGHLADIHLGHRQYGLKQREDDMRSTFKTTLQLILQDDPDAILLPGDLFHSRDLRPKVVEAAESGLSVVPDDVPVIVSRGNHDENLTPRDVTWLNYLHRRGHIILLEAELENESAEFSPHDTDAPGEESGFYDIETDEGTVRVFGLQWRGARTDTALEQVAAGIEQTAEEYGEADYTVLLAHFGIEDEVPALGGNVTHAELQPVREQVDYLALGHIHKRYDASGWLYNPGSPEAHSTSEARDDWQHGYYSVTVRNASEDSTAPSRLEHQVEHNHARRRPFHTITFDVTAYESTGDLEKAFREYVESEQPEVERELDREEFLYGGDRREPLIDLRFTGTLQFDRGSFRVDQLSEVAEEMCDALYVQTNTTRVTTADIQELLDELEDEEVFVDGRLQTAALEQRVFETIATESEFSDHAEDVAGLLGEAHRMAQGGEDTEDITSVVTERRRELFPDASKNVVLDIEEDPFADLEEDAEEDSMGDGEAATVTGGEEE